MNAPSIRELRICFAAEPETGNLFWKRRPIYHFKTQGTARRWNNTWPDKPALVGGTASGYAAGTLTISGTVYRLLRHRVMFAICNGYWPFEHLDHIDGNPRNNKLSNLRPVTNQQNMKNCQISAANTSGVTGVYWHKPRSTWCAAIGVSGKKVSLGYFKDKNEAIRARKLAEDRLGFSNRHGTREGI